MHLAHLLNRDGFVHGAAVGGLENYFKKRKKKKKTLCTLLMLKLKVISGVIIKCIKFTKNTDLLWNKEL